MLRHPDLSAPADDVNTVKCQLANMREHGRAWGSRRRLIAAVWHGRPRTAGTTATAAAPSAARRGDPVLACGIGND
jgi:hypothetical protein